MKQKYINLDSNESIFFERELEKVKSQSYDVKYPELKLANGEIIPIDTSAGPGAETVTYRQYDQVGLAKIIANYADDLPRADVKGAEFTAKIKSIGAAFGWNLQEIRAAQMVNRPLEQRRANAARRAHMQEINRIAFSGDAVCGLQGLNDNPNITEVVIPADGTGASKTFASKTADQILRDLNNLANTVFSVSKGVEVPDTVILPLAQYSLIASTPRSANSDKTILQFFLENNPFIKNVTWLNELDGAGAGGVDRMFAYRRNPDALTLEIPQAYETLPVQERGLEFVVPTHSRCGGVLIYYPLSITFADGI